MPPVSRRRFLRRVRSLSTDALADFVAALWEARGRTVRREGRVVVATDPDAGTEERILVGGEEGDDGDAEADVVVDVRGNARPPAGARLVDGDDLYDVSLYAIDREDAARVLNGHLDLPVTVEAAEGGHGVGLPDLPVSGTRPALAVVVALVVAVALLAGSLPASMAWFGGSDDTGDTSFDSQVTFVTPESTPTPTAVPETPGRIFAPLPESFVDGASPWPTLGYDAARAGYAPTIPGILSGGRAGKQRLASALVTSPVVGTEGVFAGTYDGSVYGLTNTLEIRWRSDVGDVLTATPTLENGSLYVGTVIEGASITRTNSTPTLFALDPEDGSREWAFAPGGSVHASPAVVNRTVYFTTLDGRLFALNATDGGEEWSVPVTSRIPTGPAVSNGTVYVGSGDGHVVAVDAETGRERWRVEVDAPVGGAPAVRNGTVYVGTVNGTVYALSGGTGERRWSADVGSSVRASPAVTDGQVVVPTYTGNVTGLSLETGERRWTLSLDGRIVASPAVVNGTVYVGTQAGNSYPGGADSAVFALYPDGHRRWRVSVGSPVVAAPTPTDDAVYVPTTGGTVTLVVDASEPEDE